MRGPLPPAAALPGLPGAGRHGQLLGSRRALPRAARHRDVRLRRGGEALRGRPGRQRRARTGPRGARHPGCVCRHAAHARRRRAGACVAARRAARCRGRGHVAAGGTHPRTNRHRGGHLRPADKEARGMTRDSTRWLTLAAMCSALFMFMLDATVVNLALPRMQQDLDASLTTLEWVLNVYMLSFAVLLVT